MDHHETTWLRVHPLAALHTMDESTWSIAMQCVSNCRDRKEEALPSFPVVCKPEPLDEAKSSEDDPVSENSVQVEEKSKEEETPPQRPVEDNERSNESSSSGPISALPQMATEPCSDADTASAADTNVAAKEAVEVACAATTTVAAVVQSAIAATKRSKFAARIAADSRAVVQLRIERRKRRIDVVAIFADGAASQPTRFHVDAYVGGETTALSLATQWARCTFPHVTDVTTVSCFRRKRKEMASNDTERVGSAAKHRRTEAGPPWHNNNAVACYESAPLPSS